MTLILVMELAPAIGFVDERSVPRFSTIVETYSEQIISREFWLAFAQTLQTWLTGLFIATVAGILFGITLGVLPVVQHYTATLIEFLRPIPSVALIPLAILLFGTGMQSTLLIVVFASFWPILLQTISGVRDVDPVLRDNAKVFQFKRLSVAYEVEWKSALPYIVTGLRLSTSISLILTITGEMLIGTPGLGRILALAQQSGAVSLVYSIVIVSGILGLLANLIARQAESKLLHWHTSVRTEG